jgi:hypothetical protein
VVAEEGAIRANDGLEHAVDGEKKKVDKVLKNSEKRVKVKGTVTEVDGRRKSRSNGSRSNRYFPGKPMVSASVCRVQKAYPLLYGLVYSLCAPLKTIEYFPVKCICPPLLDLSE